jgi:hypothetical protein
MSEKIDVSKHKVIIVNHSNGVNAPVDIEGIILYISILKDTPTVTSKRIVTLINEGQIDKVITSPFVSKRIKLHVRWGNDTKTTFKPSDILIRSKVVLCNNIWGSDSEDDDCLKYSIDVREYHELMPSTAYMGNKIVLRSLFDYKDHIDKITTGWRKINGPNGEISEVCFSGDVTIDTVEGTRKHSKKSRIEELSNEYGNYNEVIGRDYSTVAYNTFSSSNPCGESFTTTMSHEIPTYFSYTIANNQD